MGILRTTLPIGSQLRLISEDGKVIGFEVIAEPSAGAVTSVFGRIGAVTAEAGDYAAFYAPIGDALSRKNPTLQATILTGTQNNFAIGVNTDWLQVAPQPGNVTFTGFVAPAAGSNRLFQITNQDPSPITNTITLSHLDGGSSGTNRIVCPNATSVVLQRYESAWLWHNGNEWWVLSVGKASAASAQVSVLTGAGSYAVPTGAKFILGYAVAAGGGAGSGAVAGTTRAGGGGGGHGQIVPFFAPAASLGGSVAYSVGTGGLGGAPSTTATSNGNPGTAGGNSTFGPWVALGGAAGAGGTATSGAGATAVEGLWIGQNAGDGDDAPGMAPPTGTSTVRGSGGGGGGSVATVGQDGGAGGFNTWLAQSAAAGGVAPSGAGAAGASVPGFGLGTGGAGGAGASAGSGAGGDGGDGGDPGAGGGGGGCGLNSELPAGSGAGGDGGEGTIVVVAIF